MCVFIEFLAFWRLSRRQFEIYYIGSYYECYWSGRRDSNSRPPAPKAVFGRYPNLPIFKCFRFREMARSY